MKTTPSLLAVLAASTIACNLPNFDPANVTQLPWGRLTFQFTDCNHGEVTFSTSGIYGSGHMDLVRITQPAGLECP